MRILKMGLLASALLAALLIALAAALESEWFKGYVAGRVSERLGRELTVSGPLEIDWSLHPLLRVERVRLANAPWAGEAPMIELPALEARIDLLALALLRAEVESLRLVRPVVRLARSPDGERNWSIFHEPEQDTGPDLPFSLNALAIEQGKLFYRSPGEDTAVELAIDSAAATDPSWPLQVQGAGKRRGAPFRLTLDGGPPLALSDPGQAYPVRLHLSSGETRLRAEGTVAKPLELSGFDLALTVEGPDPAHLYPLLGLSLPRLPPYQVQGRLLFRERVWRFRNFQGTVGDSDLAGDMTIRRRDGRLFLDGELRSRRLDLDDLRPTIGGAPATGAAETASAQQRRQARQDSRDGRVLPDRELDFQRLNAMDLHVRFRGERVNAHPDLPLRDVRLEARLEGGVLRLLPLEFQLGRGEILSRWRVDGRHRPADGEVDLELRRLNLADLLAPFEIADDSGGVIGGRGQLRFRGNSVAEALGSADGRFSALMQGGRLDSVLVEAVGLDLGEALMAAGSKQSTVAVACAFAELRAKEGVARVRHLIVATEDSNFRGGGSIDFGKERLDLVIEGDPKDASVLTASSPLRIEGSFADPAVDVVSEELVAKGIAAVVGAFIAPPLALLPLVDPGDADDDAEHSCRRLAQGEAAEGEQRAAADARE